MPALCPPVADDTHAGTVSPAAMPNSGTGHLQCRRWSYELETGHIGNASVGNGRRAHCVTLLRNRVTVVPGKMQIVAEQVQRIPPILDLLRGLVDFSAHPIVVHEKRDQREQHEYSQDQADHHLDQGETARRWRRSFREVGDRRFTKVRVAALISHSAWQSAHASIRPGAAIRCHSRSVRRSPQAPPSASVPARRQSRCIHWLPPR